MFPILFCTLGKEVTMYSPHLGSRVWPPPSGQRIYTSYLEFYIEYLSVLFHLIIYLIIYLYQYKLMSIYFILWIIIWYYLILLKWLHFGQLGALSISSYVSLAYPIYFGIYFKHFLTFWRYKVFQVHPVFFLTDFLESVISPRIDYLWKISSWDLRRNQTWSWTSQLQNCEK